VTVPLKVCAGLALLVAACGAPVPPSAGGQSAAPERRATAETTLPPAFGAATGWNQLPAEIGPPTDTGPCGGKPRAKLASRIDPPVELSRGRWRFNGCVYLSGGSLTQVFIELAFPDGSKMRALVTEKTPTDQEYLYQVLVVRDDVAGVAARLFALAP
jgi:hypothetical protein